MYLEKIFGKNKEQAMRQLQFKFDPFINESTAIGLFHQRCIDTFDDQPFVQFYIKYGLIYYKNYLVPFCNKYMVGPSQKKPLFGNSKNGKWIFRAKKIKSPLGNIVWNSNMHPCAQYEIIWTNYAMNVAIRLIIWLEAMNLHAW